MSLNAKLGKGRSDASKTLSLLVLASICHSLMLVSSPPAQGQFQEPGQLPGQFQEPNRFQPGRRSSLGEIDEIMNQIMQQFHVPGGSCAVAYGGKLVYAKGFGVANLRTGEPATPNTLFNLASCTKAISAFGALRLQEQGKLNLDTPFWDVIGRPMTADGRPPRPRIQEITVRQLLHHSGGWNDDSGFDTAGKQINRMAPNGLPYSEAVRVLLQTPLDYPPGTQAKYANGQWNLIKYVIECASQEPYGRYMRKQLRSIGIE
ncbi:MAG: hypothetical protein QG574_2925, partial [Cyanobacteriota bacterium erpe_2018_sw_21hr_WHONDRS-SW48-000092_B_bin.40]|nr:hypothetical protein [Cyanobacteriota bacterium erpe_2018_sw_21hr_WHONDRS-SW48-000092_B_bin.40]